jgi:C-terminal processing protease CtpA/Prc
VSAGYGISRSTGALPVGKITVTEVIAGSPAAAAGLRVRDEIIAAGSIRVESDVIGVARAISSLPVGGRLTLTLHRDGIDVTVELHRP